MTALKGKGKAAVKIGMQYGKLIYCFNILQASKMKTKSLFQGY